MTLRSAASNKTAYEKTEHRTKERRVRCYVYYMHPAAFRRIFELSKAQDRKGIVKEIIKAARLCKQVLAGKIPLHFRRASKQGCLQKSPINMRYSECCTAAARLGLSRQKQKIFAVSYILCKPNDDKGKYSNVLYAERGADWNSLPGSLKRLLAENLFVGGRLPYFECVWPPLILCLIPFSPCFCLHFTLFLLTSFAKEHEIT